MYNSNRAIQENHRFLLNSPVTLSFLNKIEKLSNCTGSLLQFILFRGRIIKKIWQIFILIAKLFELFGFLLIFICIVIQ